MSRKVAVLFAALMAVLLVTASVASADYEDQGWVTKSPTQVAHVHNMVMGVSQFDTISSPRQVTVRTLFHNRDVGDTLKYVRWDEGPGNTRQTVDFPDYKATGANEEFHDTTITLDPAKFANSGWREVRVHPEIAMVRDGREFATTRLCVFVQNGKPRSDYCGGPTTKGRCGGGAWYEKTLYLVSFVDCRDVKHAQTGMHPGDTLRIRTQSSGGGAYSWDPAFHLSPPNPGSFGGTTPANNAVKTITVPPLAPGVHKLIIRDQKLGDAGVYVLPVNVL